MSTILLRLNLVLSFALAICGLKSLNEEKHLTKVEKHLTANGPGGAAQGKYFDQRLDHFDRQNSKQFSQRYFINDTFWDGGEKTPVFLCVGGEGPPLDSSVLVDSEHCSDMVELAAQNGALMLALEHRYYGFSQPFGYDFSTPNLRWLSTEQALGDIAAFHSYISEKHDLKPSNYWVTFGGSYPGMVAGLARLRYPHLIHAAVSSSAPLHGTVEMPGYNDVTAASVANADVGGSKMCLDILRTGHANIGDLLGSQEGRRYLEKEFNLCTPNSLEDPLNREQFAGDGVVGIPAQSNDPACTDPYCNIAKICEFLTTYKPSESSVRPSLNMGVHVSPQMEALAALAQIQNGGSCVVADYDAMIKAVSAPSLPDRTWLYQTCTEWGFYQVCHTDSECPFTQGLHTVDIDMDICLKAFGIPKEDVYTQVAYGGTQYGGLHLQSSRILFVNGEIDPWRANSIIDAPNDMETTYWVKGSSHHYWTHPSLPTDAPEIVKARQVIWNQVREWLRQDDK